MSMTYKDLIWASLVASILACNLYPFTSADVYFFFKGVEKLNIALIIVHLTKWDIKTNRVAWICLLWSVLDLVKETSKLTGLNFFFDPTQFKSIEYVLYIIVAIACLVGFRGLFKLILFYILNFRSPCRTRTNWIDTPYQINYVSRYFNGGLVA